jgi:hypothetical protein
MIGKCLWFRLMWWLGYALVAAIVLGIVALTLELWLDP